MSADFLVPSQQVRGVKFHTTMARKQVTVGSQMLFQQLANAELHMTVRASIEFMAPALLMCQQGFRELENREASGAGER